VSDPIIESAQRAWTSEGWPGELELSEGSLAKAAAREMAKPIREWFDLNHGRSAIEDALLDTLAPLIFSSEELQ